MAAYAVQYIIWQYMIWQVHDMAVHIMAVHDMAVHIMAVHDMQYGYGSQVSTQDLPSISRYWEHPAPFALFMITSVHTLVILENVYGRS
jgi:hypothetical protein